METKAHIRPPTEKQLKFAVAIAKRLHICLPPVQTRQSLFLFIRDNKPRFEKPGVGLSGKCLTAQMSDMSKYLGLDIDPYDQDDAEITDLLGPEPILGGIL